MWPWNILRASPPPLFFNPVTCTNTEEGRDPTFTPVQIDYLVNSAAASLGTILDFVAFLKKKVADQRRLALWYNSQIHRVKQFVLEFWIAW